MKLLGDLRGAYSRRINIQHGLVYQVIEDKHTVKAIRMWSRLRVVVAVPGSRGNERSALRSTELRFIEAARRFMDDAAAAGLDIVVSPNKSGGDCLFGRKEPADRFGIRGFEKRADRPGICDRRSAVPW